MTTNDTTHEAQHDTAAGAERAPEQPPRLPWAKLVPEVYKTMAKLEAVTRQGVDPVVLELVKLRASQLNHCAYCLDMHTKDALAAGESPARIMQLNAWEESAHFYSPKELAALRLTDAVTVLTDGFVSDEVYAEAAEHFEQTELAQLIAAITMINAWNRLSVASRMPPGHYTPDAAG